MKDNKILRISVIGLFIALCYVGVLFNIPIRIAGSGTMIHLGNTFCMLGALLLGGLYGGVAGALGMTFFDLTSDWAPYAPSTFILKLCIGLICGTVFHLLMKKGVKEQLAALIGCICAGAFNIIASPVIGSYLTNKYIIGSDPDAAKIIASWQSMTSTINAIIAVVIATVVYSALSLALKKSGILAILRPVKPQQ